MSERESFAEQLTRLAMMSVDDGETWDLSDNDQEAIKAALSKIGALREELEQALDILSAVEWNGHGMAKCPFCFGWEQKGNGETERHHNSGCKLAKALSNASQRSRRGLGNPHISAQP